MATGKTSFSADYESVALSSRIRLARNFQDYPFPNRLIKDSHAVEQASEIISLISAELNAVEEFTLYEMDAISEEQAEFLTERHLISRDLMRNKKISAALISHDESISVMLNEEDHVREQYFMKGFDLQRAFERISGIDEIISDSVPFAYDSELGYLTACPTNLGTGLRASVMLFLPALSRRGRMKQLISTLTRLDLTVRGAFGEGSGAEGNLYQVSNEVTLGKTEGELLSGVESAVDIIVEAELLERARMKAEEGVALKDKIMRSLGVLTNCCLLEEKEFTHRMSDLKLGVALGYFGTVEGRDDRMSDLDELAVSMRPAGIQRLHGAPLSEGEESACRADFVRRAIKQMQLIDVE